MDTMTRQPEENDPCREAFEKFYPTIEGVMLTAKERSYMAFKAAWSMCVADGVSLTDEQAATVLKALQEASNTAGAMNMDEEMSIISEAISIMKRGGVDAESP